MPTSLIAPLVGAGASFGLSKLFGGGSSSAPQIGYQPIGFTAGGLDASATGVTPQAGRTALVNSLSDASGNEADIYGGLRQTVAPGFNDLLNSRLTDLNNTATKSIGDLRQNLASRRVLGSSFGNDTINRLQTSIGQQRDSVIADNFLKSLAVNQQLTQQEFTARRHQFQTGLDELNLEADIALKLNNQANGILAQNARTQAELDAKAAAGSGQFFGNLLQPVGKAIGTGASNLFGSFGSSGGGGLSGIGSSAFSSGFGGF